jgi:hypothetical protein
VETPNDDALVTFTKWISELRTDLAGSVSGVLLRGALVVPVGSAANATSRPTTTGGALVGYGLRNTDPANPATVYLRDGADSDGTLVVPIQLAGGAAASAWFGPGGLNLVSGLFVDIAAGAVEGTVHLRGAD